MRLIHNYRLCIGCRACEMACQDYHHLPPDQKYMEVRETTREILQDLSRTEATVPEPLLKTVFTLHPEPGCRQKKDCGDLPPCQEACYYQLITAKTDRF